MAFNMKPGRLSFQKTGNGLPSALLQVGPKQNPVSGNDLKEKALAEAKAKQLLAGENKGAAKDVRTFEGTASAKIPGKPVEKIASTPAEVAKWKAAKTKAEQEGKPFGEQYKPKTITEKASVSDTGMDKPQITTKPELTTTPPKNPVSGTPSRTIYTIEGSRGYAGEANKGKIGSRGLVTLNEKRAQKEIDFTNKMNALTNKKYAQAKEGDEAARGLTGKALERRNKIVEERRQALTRPMPVIKTTEADKGTAVRAANAMNAANWESNIAKNKAEGIDRVVFQKKSENKKAMKKSPAKQMKSKAKTPAKMKKY
jgi:hypothetical protein